MLILTNKDGSRRYIRTDRKGMDMPTDGFVEVDLKCYEEFLGLYPDTEILRSPDGVWDLKRITRIAFEARGRYFIRDEVNARSR